MTNEKVATLVVAMNDQTGKEGLVFAHYDYSDGYPRLGYIWDGNGFNDPPDNTVRPLDIYDAIQIDCDELMLAAKNHGFTHICLNPQTNTALEVSFWIKMIEKRKESPTTKLCGSDA